MRSTADDGRSAVPDVCVLVPAYNEAPNLDALYAEVCRVLDGTGHAWQFLFVDDGSRDATPQILERLRAADPRVHWIRLARNFGLQAALAAGLRHADARAAVIMDADLQDDPAALPEMLKAWQDGADVDALNVMPERNRYLPGLRAWVGFRQVPVPVHRRARHAGAPVQSFWRLLTLGLDGIFAFSRAPLRMATLLGFIVTAGAALALLVVVYWRFIERTFPEGIGQATIALSLLFLGGVQLLVIGIMGEYIGRIYEEVKQRPHFVVGSVDGCPVSLRAGAEELR
jgi:polyisoprenyl-phosphate glycosyltransferase